MNVLSYSSRVHPYPFLSKGVGDIWSGYGHKNPEVTGGEL